MPRQEILIIERFEGNVAVIKYGDVIFTLPKNLLPRAAKENDVIKMAVALDTEGTARYKKEKINR